MKLWSYTVSPPTASDNKMDGMAAGTNVAAESQGMRLNNVYLEF